MKKVQNGLIFNPVLGMDAYTALQKVLGAAELSVAQWNALEKTFMSVSNQVEFVNKKYNELIKKYGKEKDGIITLDDDQEKRVKFFNEYNELLSLEEELDIRDFDIDTLEDVKMKFNERTILKQLFSNDKESKSE